MIPLFKPYLGPDTLEAAREALELGWLGMGSYVKGFEEELSAFLQLPPERVLVALNTGTSALHLALEVAGVGPGDEVITPALNNIGDFQAIGMCGAQPVFVDIRQSDLGIDPELIERLVGPRVRAIIAMHYLGIPCDLRGVIEVAERHGLRVIEDAAHAIGSLNDGKPVGSFGDLTCFSFDPIKTITCIDGGALVVPNPAEAEGLYPARLLGMTQSNERLYANSRSYGHDVLGQGYRYHLANLHAAIGLNQLRRLPEFILNRRSYARAYSELLSNLPGVVTPRTDFENVSVFQYVIRVLDGRRGELAKFLEEQGVETGIHWIPGNRFTWLQRCRGADNLPVTDRIGEEILTLPLWSYMDEGIVERVADEIRSFFREPRNETRVAQSSGADALADAKRSSRTVPIKGIDGLVLRAVRVADPFQGDIDRITHWRNRFGRSFLTEFEATPERTRSWLTGSVSRDPGRILFMIEQPDHDPIGYIGLAFIDWEIGYAEADSVVRGESEHPGAMRAAMRTMIDWARSELGIKRIGVRVFADNPALSFYEGFGGRESSRTPLRRTVREDCVAWEPMPERAQQPEDVRWLVHMDLSA